MAGSGSPWAERRRGEAHWDVFVSYRRATDEPLAAALQTGLGRFARPWYRRRSVAVFRDRTGLAVDPSLWGAIEHGLSNADHLLLLASPEAAASPWVGREVEWWLANRDPHRLLIALAAGTITPTGRGSTALPPALVAAVDEEPLWVDLRWARDTPELSLRDPRLRDAVAELTAAVRGIPKDELVGEDLVQHRRTRRLARGAVALLATFLLAAVVGAIVAVQQRDLARDQATVARSRALAASADAVAERRVDVASLLATEAWRERPAPETVAALARAAVAEPELDWVRTVDGAVTAVAASPDGRRLVTVDEAGDVLAWDPASPRPRMLTAVPERVLHLVVADDGRLALGGAGGVSLRGADGAETATITRDATVVDLALDPDGDAVVLWDDEQVTRHDPDGTQRASATTASCGWVAALPDGVRVVSCVGSSWLLDPQLQAVAVDDRLQTPAGDYVAGASADARWFGLAKNGHITVVPGVDVEDDPGEHPDSLPSAGLLDVSADGRRVALASGARIGIVDGVTADGETPSRATIHGGIGVVDHMLLVGDGAQLLATSRDRVAVWTLDGLPATADVLGPVPDEATFVFAPRGASSGDGRWLAWVDEAGGALVDLASPSPVPVRFAANGGARPHLVAGDRLLVVDDDGGGSLWDLADVAGDPVTTWEGTPSTEWPLYGRASTVDADGELVRTFDGQRVRTSGPGRAPGAGVVVPGNPATVSGAAFDRDGGRLAVARCGTVEVVDAATGARRQSMDVPGCAVDVAWDGDDRLVVVEREGTLRRRTDDGAWGPPLDTGSTTVSVSRRGAHALVADPDGTTTLWDLAAAAPVVALAPPAAPDALADAPGAATGVVFLAGDAAVVTLVPGGPAVRWDLEPDGHARIACRRAGRELTDLEWDRYAGTSPPAEPTCAWVARTS